MNKNRFVTFMMVLATIISSCTDSRSQRTKQNTDETGMAVNAVRQESGISDIQDPEEEDGKEADAASIPNGAAILMKAYPDFIMGYEGGKLLLKDGSRMVYDDGRKKSFEENSMTPTLKTCSPSVTTGAESSLNIFRMLDEAVVRPSSRKCTEPLLQQLSATSSA